MSDKIYSNIKVTKGVPDMKLLVIILNKTECLEELLEAFTENNISGATIIDSKGMLQELYEHDEFKFIGSLRSLFNPEHTENKTILMVTKEERVKEISKITNDVTGGLDKPDTGILFTLPIDYLEGLSH